MSCTTTNENKKSKYMNQAIENIHQRKSVRSYTADTVPMETLQELVKAAMAAPTGKNVQPWEFIIVTDRQKLDSMAESLPFAKMLSKAGCAIVVCGNNNPENGGSITWDLDCSAATQNILLAAESLGLGAVWTAVHPYAERIEPVVKILNLPQDIIPLSAIPVGFPSKEHKPREKYNAEKIHINQW